MREREREREIRISSWALIATIIKGKIQTRAQNN